MYRVFISFIFVFSIAVQSTEIDFSQFKLHKSELDQKVWSFDHSILVYKKIGIEKNFSFENFVDYSLRNKEKALSFLGVKNWNIHKKEKGNNSIIIVGSYVDNQNKVVQFVDYQKLKGEKVSTVLLTTTDKKNYYNLENVRSLLEKIHDEN